MSKTTITPTDNGPLKVEDPPTLKGMFDDKEYETKATVFLCRCGGSQNKPFCDGTHAKIGFTGDRSPERVADKRDDYTGSGIVIHDNRGVCAHAAVCGKNLATVFRAGTEPWIDASAATADEIRETIDKCPSGALSYSIDGVEHRDHDSEPAILIAPGGPYAVRGGAKLNAEFGEGASEEHYTLCRCGQSTNKPFCSGAHWDHKFDD